MEQQAASASAPVTSIPANVTQDTPAVSGDGMNVDVPTTSARPQGKRKASEEPEIDGGASKKVRMGKI